MCGATEDGVRERKRKRTEKWGEGREMKEIGVMECIEGGGG